MDRKKKIILAAVAATAIIYFATKKKSGTKLNSSKNSNSFQLSNLTNDLWTNGVGVSPFNSTRGWGSQTQLLLNKSGNEHLISKITNGKRLKLKDGTFITAENILDLGIDDFLRISTLENVSGLVNIAGYPNLIEIV